MHLPYLNFKDIVTSVKNMDIELTNVEPKKNLTRHLKGKFMNLRKVTLTIGITTHGITIIIMESMDTFHKITLRHTLEVITRNG